MRRWYHPSTTIWRCCVERVLVPRTTIGRRQFATSSSWHHSNKDYYETCALADLISFPDLSLMPPPTSGYLSLRPGQRLVCLGDVHGDVAALQHMLRLAGVVDSSSDTLTWTGGDTVVVQTGDVMDRGPHELACWALLSRLSRQAAAHGGTLTALWGNHEVMSALGLFQYTTGGDAEFEYYLGRPLDHIVAVPSGIPTWRRQFAGNQPARWAACEPGGLLAHTLWQHLSVALVVGRTVVVHAGLTVEHLEEYEHANHDDNQSNHNSNQYPHPPLAALNAAARNWITTVHHGSNVNALPSHVAGDDIIGLANARARAAVQTQPACLGGRSRRARNDNDSGDDESPVWLRQYSDLADDDAATAVAQTKLDAVLQRLGADRMVMGHTPQASGINVALQGKAWRIDTAASRGMGGGPVQVLEIVHGGGDTGHDVIHVIDTNGSRIPAEERHVEKVAPAAKSPP